MGCCKKKKVKNDKAAGSLAPSDKYHRNPQGGHHHRHTNVEEGGGGGGGGDLEPNNSNNSRGASTSTNNNNQFSHNNGITPTSRRAGNSSTNLHDNQVQHLQHEEAVIDYEEQQQQYLIQHQQQLIQSPYHFYPSGSIGGSAASITSSSLLQLQHHHPQSAQQQQPPYLVYQSNHSSSSGNGSHIIDGSINNGSIVEGSDHKYYYYCNGYYYPATLVLKGAAGGGEYEGERGEEQIFTISATTQGKHVSMGRVGEDVYHPPGSPASITGITGANGGAHTNGSGLFKSKSGSIPVTGSPLARGFRDTFVSSMSPAHALSAESSPLHRSASANTANSSPNPDKFSSSANNNVSGGVGKEGNKKWTFGGLFRRNKTKSVSGAHSNAGVSSNATVTLASSNNNSIVVENGGAHKLNNNNYGNGSPLIVRPVRTYGYPARPASSVGFVSVDPTGYLGHGEIGNRHSILSTSIPSSTTPKFVNAVCQTRAKGKLSESDISTCDSDFELALENPHDNPPEPAPQESNSAKQTNGDSGGGGSGYKQNFLVRRLSRRKEKAAAKKQAALAAQVQAQASQGASLASGSNQHNSSNGFISSSSQQHGGYLDVPPMKQRVGSSPDSLNNSSEPWPSWETTKKPQTPIHAIQHQQHRLLQQNYSSNGSLSQSQEGGYNSNNNSINSSNNHAGKSSKAAAKEAVKARAIARRESFLRESSSSDEDTEERSQSSLQGSFSSLNSRNRRQRAFNMQQAQFQQHRHLFPSTSGAGGGGGISCASPSSPMPVPLDYRNSVSATASPNMNRRLMMMGPPGSPKWDARLIYQHQQEGALSENGGGGGSNSNQAGGGVVRLPRKTAEKSGPATASNPGQMSQNNGDQQSFIMATEMISEDQHVVTAGLKVPFLPVQNPQPHHQDQQSMLRNGQLMYPTEEPVQYANVANGMRGQSSTPTVTSSSYNNAIHHASPTPPPPPPPRRAPIGPNNPATNPNFYRPVSCSYLDSYANQLQQLNEHQHHHHHPMRQQSPMIFNGNYIYPPQTTPSPQQQHYQGQSQEAIMNGVAGQGGGIARSSPRRFAPSATPLSGNNNQPDVDSYRHPPLIRSPSEPPAVRVEQARISSSPVKRLLSSPMSNGNNSENNSDGGAGKSVITSKLGFPVRRLQEASKLTGPQGPVHLRASEFWRKKESEVATAGSSSSPVGGGAGGANHQKKYLSRIRSADSSPLPVPKMRKSPGGVAASNESISSLSSFSENAASPGPPKNCSSPINPVGILKHGGHQPSQMKGTPLRAQISKTPNPQQLTYGNNNKDKENNNGPQQQSAVERLKVRIPSAPDGIRNTSSSTNPPRSSTPTGGRNNPATGESARVGGGSISNMESNNNPIRSLIELNNGKTPGKNLEDALNELEDMYKSLRLSDEDLLDRAERRDLPTRHQELRELPLIPIPQAYHRFEHLGSVESLGTGSGSSGTNYTGASFSGGEAQPQQQQRVRAPPVRRSSRPDTVSDDMANRRLAFPDGKALDPRLMVAKTGSYLARSPAFSPCTSPCPPDGSPYQHHAFPLSTVLGQEDPDLTLDDVTYRNYQRANAIRIIDPQPLFGIPLGPISAAPANDYLHSKPSESYRPIFGSLKTPDVVNDDIAFRNLRKDLGQDATLTSNKDWTPRLFSPNRETSFNYPNVKDGKKLRAIRSLSANITHMIPPNSRGSNNSTSRDSPTSPFRHQPFKDNIGKWSSSYSDLHRRASSYLQPSWVEQIEKVQTSTETLTDHRNSSRFSTAILDPPEHWERKFPKKTVELTPAIYDPDKPRRPWTDIILESFEKEKQKELERIAAEAEAAAVAAANENVSSDANNKTGAKSELEGDDDVFIDASEEVSKSENAAPGITQVGQSGNTIKISGNGSKNNDPESFQQTRPNMDTVDDAKIPLLTRPLPLLPGQINRRGSWVEPSRSYSSTTAFHASEFIPATAPVVSASHPSPNPFCQDKRRKSWSDLPKDIDSFSASTPGPIILSGSSCSASPTRKLFNPLPPPKKIRQINLEAFNNNNSNNGSSALSPTSAEEAPPTTPLQEQVKSNSSSSIESNNFRDKETTRNSRVTLSDKVKSASFFPSTKAQGDELNEIMDQLLRDADACSQSIRDRSGSPRSSPRTVKGKVQSTEGDREKKKSISPTGAAGGVSIINTQRREMKTDENTSSSGQAGKQDLSCTIVGIIPKQPSPPRDEEEATPDRNNQRVEQQKPTFPHHQKQVSPTETDSSALGSRKLSKIDNGRESVSVPKERGNALSTLDSSDPIPIYDGRSSTPKNNGAGAASSIEDLIESINESLPELEASCGVPGITTDSTTHSSEGKQSGSPSSSIPSPSPGSPIPPILSVSVKKEAGRNDDDSGPAAFPVPAKRHHLPSKCEEESLYENLPSMAIRLRQAATEKATGNDEKLSSSPFPYNEVGESYIDPLYPHHHHPEETSGTIPPFVTINRDGDGGRRSSREASQRRAPHSNEDDDHEADGDNEEEETQHSTSSSHQPSSLSSNDSSEAAQGGRAGGEAENRKEQRNPSTNNSIQDNINTRSPVDQTGSTSSTLPSSLPTATTASSSDTLANNTNNNATTETSTASNTPRNSSLSSSRESLMRKKSEGLPSSNPISYSNDRDDCLRKAKSSSSCFHSKEASSPGKLLSQAQYKINKAEGKENKGKGESCGNVSRFMSRLSSSSVEEASSPTKQSEQRPVAPASSSSTFRSSQQQQQTKSSSSTGLAATPSGTAEVSASETGPGTGMSFLRNNFPFFRNSTSRSRSQSVISDVSRSSETGDSKKEKDKSYRRKSHLNRAFTDEPVPDNDYGVDITPKSSKPTSHDHEASSLESSAVEETRSCHCNSKPNVKIHPAIPPVLTCNNNKSDSNLCKSMNRNSQNVESTPSSPSPLTKNASCGKIQGGEQIMRKGTPVAKKDSFSDAEGVSFIKKMLQKESDRDRAAAAAAGGGGNGSKQNAQATVPNGNGSFNIKKSPSAGNQSYWSKFSSSQSAFLRKLFEKPKASEVPANLNKSNGKSSSQPTTENCNGVVNNNLNSSQSGGEENNPEKESSEKENAEPVLGFSVAQKASFFMKLEHEQRFSKWRKNSVDLGDIGSHKIAEQLNGRATGNNTVVANNAAQFRSRSSRHFTQPVTPTELIDIPLMITAKSSSIVENQGRHTVEFGSQPAIYWGNNSSSNLVGNGMADSSENNENPSNVTKSFYKEYDDMHKFEPIVNERDSKYDGLLAEKLDPSQGFPEAPPTPTMKSYSLTRSNRNTASNHHGLNHLGGFPMYHSASAIINSNVPIATSKSSTTTNFHKMPGTAYSSSSSFSDAMSRHDSTKFIPMPNNHNPSGSGNRKGKDPPVYENGDCQRRGSASDLELSGTANQSPLLPRAEKVKSMFISRSGYHCDPENLSEDGEFSSGGQEVAEIICRSYENSPVFRKKNWRAQKHTQSNFTKEIWRRCGNYENWGQRSSTNPPLQQIQPQHPIPQTFTATTNVIEVNTGPIPSTYLPTVAASPPPTTSNLLQILTVLSSSNDELTESKPKSKKHYRQQGGSHPKQNNLPTGSSSIPPSPCHRNSHSVEPFRRSNTSNAANCYSNNSSAGNTLNRTMPQAPVSESNQIFVSVPHPEDEAFQSFFCSVKSYTQVTHYPEGVLTTTSAMNGDRGEPFQQQYENNVHDNMANGMVNGMDQIPCGGAISQSDEAIDISSVRRESDLLVMKRNVVPPAKRKSINGKYKNPLRALAARMDFRQQGYTQQSHSNSNNSVNCGSDVDVKT